MDPYSEPSATQSTHRRILFICTGNFYRSRFAEAVFNYHAEKRQIPWTAFSRGLAVHLVDGHLSTHTAEALHTRQIELRHTRAGRIQLSEDDLLKSNHRVAMDRSEHFQMMINQFPAWADQIDYWDVSDLHLRSSLEALPEIELKVIQLLEKVC
ncbi:MAG: low molecular weight phosphatase family protein [Verrucomicrobia bacterium]|nr:low molecular weight phosphatase family protein [Verrucomicrobiota bacterium]MBV8377540.1 low molecular weight phosphatase family protein [Verrucomicrobiota bacterium]